MTLDLNSSPADRRQRLKQTRIGLFIAAGLLLIVAALLGLAGTALGGSSRQARVGQKLQDFSLTDLNGRQVKLSDYAGRPVLFNAWATWCPPCRDEMPLLEQYYRQHRAEKLVILAVEGGDPPEEVADFVSRNGLTFPVLLDTNANLLDQMNIYDYPTSILIGPDGVVKAIHIGMFTPSMLEKEITPLLK